LIFSILVAVILNNEYILNAPNLPVPRLIGAFIAFVFTDVALAVCKSTLYSQEDQIEALYRSIGRKKAQINLANLEIALISREWAQHIHGTLASKLLTAAAILENSIPGQDLVSKESAIREATHIMNGEFAIPPKRERSLMQEFTHRVHQWSSIINIETHGVVDLHLPSISVEKFGLAIEEALANAFRHGQATKVRIFLKKIDEHSFECTISDNGIGLAEYQRNGLGSSLFEDIAPGKWSRELGADGVGTCLRLLVSAPNNPSVGDK
jgi:signal transduction histidine kinase